MRAPGDVRRTSRRGADRRLAPPAPLDHRAPCRGGGPRDLEGRVARKGPQGPGRLSGLLDSVDLRRPTSGWRGRTAVTWPPPTRSAIWSERAARRSRTPNASARKRDSALDNARKFATEEKRRVRLFRRWAIAMAVAPVVLAALVLAYSSTRRANRNEGVATSNEAKAKASEIEAKKSEKRAKEKEKLAIENEQKAKAQARIANLRRLLPFRIGEEQTFRPVAPLGGRNAHIPQEGESRRVTRRPLSGLAGPAWTHFVLAYKRGAVPSVAFSPDGKTSPQDTASAPAAWCCGTWPSRSAWTTAPRRERGLGQERGLQPRRQDPRRRIQRHRRRPLGRRRGAVGRGRAARLADRPLAVNEGYVTSVAFSPDGKTIAAGYGVGVGRGVGGVVLWDVAARKRLADEPLPVNEGNVTSVAFSPDGKTIAAGYGVVGGGIGGVVLWDVALAAPGRRPSPRDRGLRTSVAFSPDGKTIAAGYRGGGGVGGVVLWDVAARKRLADGPLPVNEGVVNSVAFSPDGKTIAAGYGVGGGVGGGGVVLWDVAARKRLVDGPLAVTEGDVSSVAFSPDGKTIAAGYGGGGAERRGAVGRGRTQTPGRRAPAREGGRRSERGLQPRRQDHRRRIRQRGVGGVGGVVLWDVAARQAPVDEPPRRERGRRSERGLQPRRQDHRRRIRRRRGGGRRGAVGRGARATPGRRARSPVNEGIVQSVAFSPDGKTIAAGYGVGRRRQRRRGAVGRGGAQTPGRRAARRDGGQR